MADEEVVVNLTYDARASAQRLGADLDNSISKLQKVVDKTNEVSKSVERVNGSYSGLGRLADNLANSLDPWNNSLRTAIKEVDTLTTKITALNSKQSRNVDEDALLTKSLQVRGLLVQKVEELRVASLAAAAAQDKLNSQAYIEGFSKFVTITKAATVSVEAHTQALNLFKLKIDTTITSLSSFANAQQVLANSTSRMTGDWTAATSLMTRLTEQFNPGIVAAKGMTAAMLELNTANKLGIISGDAFVAEQKRIADSFDPVIVKARAAAEAENQAHQAALQSFQAMVGGARADQVAQNSQQFFNQTLGVNPTSGAGTAAQSASVFQKGFAQDAAEIENAKRDADALAVSVKTAADRIDYLTNKFNQDATAARIYRQTILEIDEALSKGAIGFREVGVETGKAIDVYNRSTVSGQKVIENTKAQTNAQFLNRIGLLELQAAGVNTFQAIFSGMSITHVAMMEGAQVIGAVIQGGRTLTQVMEGLSNALSKGFAFLTSGVGMIVVGLTALAGALAIVLTRAISNENQLRRFDTQLGGITQTSVTTSVGLQKLSFDLRGIGVAAADAEKGILSLGQNLNINSQGNANAIAASSRISLNVGARLGIGDAAGFAKYNEAVNQGVAGVIKLGLETRSLTTDEAKAAQIEALHGNAIKAVNDVLAIIDIRLAGVHKRSMDDATQGVHSLVGEWNTLLNKLADLVSWKAVEGEAATFIRGLSNLFDLIKALTTGDFKINLSINWPGGMTTEQVTEMLNKLVPGGVTPSADQAAKNRAYFFANRDSNGNPIPTPAGSAGISSVIPGGALAGNTVDNWETRNFNFGGIRRPGIVAGPNAGGFQSFSGPEEGVAAIKNLLTVYQDKHGLDTIATIISRWAPPSENDTKLLIARAEQITGFGANQSIDLHNPLTMQKMIEATIRNEQGGKLPVDPGIISKVAGVDKFLAELGGTSGATVPLVNVPKFDLGGTPISATAPGFASGGMGSNLFTKSPVLDPKIVRESEDAVAKYNETFAKGDIVAGDAIRNAAKLNIEQAASIAGTNAYRAAIDAKMSVDESKNLAAQEYNKTLQVGQIELGKAIETQQIQIRGDNQVTDSLEGGTAAMLQADARTKAILDNRQRGIPIEQAYAQALAESAATAGKSAAEATAAMTPEIAAQERLGVALNKSAAAAHEVEVINQAAAATQKVKDAAEAAGIPLEEGRIQQLLKTNLAKTKQLDLDKQIVAVRQSNIQSQNEIQILNLQVGLQGKTSQEIEKQTSLLQEKQKLEAEGLTPLDADYQKRLLIVAAVGDMKIKLDDAQRAQQRLEDGLKQMAETIGTGIVTALQGLFDKSKVTDWMATIKQGLQTIGQQLVSSTLIKPLTGSIFNALGLTKLGQEFGSFGGGSSGGGILGGLFGGGSGSSSGGTITLVPNSSGGFDLKQAASNGKGLLDAFTGSGSSSSSSGGFLNNLLFGSGAVNSGFAAGTGAGEGIFTNLATGVTSDILPSVATEATSGISQGLLGGLGLGGLSSLGSVVPFIGPVIGLASMFLGGLFNKKPANNVSTGGINLSAGGSIVANPFSSGNAQNDQTAKQITDSISTFTKNILKETGGAISGNIDVQAGTRDGIKIGGTIGSVATGLVGVMKFTDAASAIAATTLAIAQHLEGVSDTMKNVLGQLTDPAQIENAVQFVNIYDKLDKALKDSTVSVEAADAAFSSIASDTKGSGPFAQAMDQINTTFQTLTDTATGFGLALEPINFGLAEATKRLKGDFLSALHSTFESVAGQDFINQLNSARQSYESNLKEATAVGLGSDQNTLDQISSVYNFQIYNILKGLSITQLDIVKNDLTDAFSVANPEINTLAENMKNVAFAANLALKATGDASAAFAGFASGLQALRDLVVNLTVGQLSGAKIGTQIAAANENFSTELGLVKAGNLNELGNLATAGGNTVSLSQTAYGNAPQTARIRETILSGVNDILGNLPIPAFARGTRSTPEGMILVGEEGPELVMQGGGNKVIPLSGRGGNISELKAEIARLGEIVQNGIMVNREGFSQSVNHLGKISSNTEATKSLTPAMRRTA